MCKSLRFEMIINRMSKLDLTVIDARLEELRQKKILTQEEIAEKIELTTKLDLISFGLRLKELRKAKGLTQEALAESIHLTPNFIGMVERGERNTSVDKIFKLAKALNVSLEEFFKTL